MKYELALFDLGGVALEVQSDYLIHQVSQLVGKSFDEVHEEIYHPEWLLPLEVGKISGEDYFKHLKEKLSLSWNYEQFMRSWNGILSEKKDVIDLMKRLSLQLRLMALTNTNELHLQHIKANVTSLAFFEEWIASCDIGHRKPEPEIYHSALQKAGVEAYQTIYVDDRPEMVEGGRAIGLTAIRFESAAQLNDDLEKLGIALG